MALSVNDLGNIATGEKRYQTAADHYRRPLETAREIGALPLALYVLAGIAALKAQQGNAEEALALALLALNHDSSFEMVNDKAEQVVEEVRAARGPDALDPEVHARSAAAADPERLHAILDALLSKSDR